MDLGLSDRVYVVLGASRGLGRACAQELATEGARLVLTGRDEAGLQATARPLGGSERALVLSGDISEPGMETCLAAAAIAKFGRLDGAVICIPRNSSGSFMATPDESWRLSFETTFLGPLRLARTIARHISYEGGSIVFIVNQQPRDLDISHVVDDATRWAVHGISRHMAEELGPRNIRVNTVLAGQFETDSTRTRAKDRHEESCADTNRIPLGRCGEVFELARPTIYLLSPAASYLTGTVFNVDGGQIH